MKTLFPYSDSVLITFILPALPTSAQAPGVFCLGSPNSETTSISALIHLTLEQCAISGEEEQGALSAFSGLSLLYYLW